MDKVIFYKLNKSFFQQFRILPNSTNISFPRQMMGFAIKWRLDPDPWVLKTAENGNNNQLEPYTWTLEPTASQPFCSGLDP